MVRNKWSKGSGLATNDEAVTAPRTATVLAQASCKGGLEVGFCLLALTHGPQARRSCNDKFVRSDQMPRRVQ